MMLDLGTCCRFRVVWIGLILLFKCSIHVQPVFSQEPAYINYGVDEGLPTSEVYQSIQDDRGFMWFATDRGLVRFDGITFLAVKRKEDERSETVFGFHKDQGGRIWFYTYHEGIGYLSGDSLITPAYNDAVIQVMTGSVAGSMHVSQTGEVWLSGSRDSKVVKVSADGRVKRVELNNSEMLAHITKVGENGWISSGGEGLTRTPSSNAIAFRSKDETIKIPLPLGNSQVLPGASVLVAHERFYCTQNNTLLSFNETGDVLQSVLLPSAATFSLYEDASGTVWTGCLREGAFRFENGDLTKLTAPFLAGHSVSSVFQDREGGFWFTTLDAGVYYVPDLGVLSLRFDDGDPVTALSNADSVLWVGTKHGSVFQCSMNGAGANDPVYEGLGEVFGIRSDGPHLIINTALGPTDVASSDLKVCHATFRWKPFRSCLSALPDEIFAVSQSEGIGQFTEHTSGLHLSIGNYWNERLYVGGRSGLYRISGMTNPSLVEIDLGMNSPWITDIEATCSALFLATKERGIIIHDSMRSWSIDVGWGLPTNQISALAAEGDSVLWAGTKKGLVKISIDLDAKWARVELVSRGNGLISNEVNAVLVAGDKVWVGTNVGLSFFSLNHRFKNEVPPKVHLQRMLVNGSEQSLLSGKTFDHTARAFDFKFVGLSFQNSSQKRFKYQLEGFDQEVSFTSSTQVRYMLPPGSYLFKVWAQNGSGLWSEQPAEYAFSIAAPFWKRNWFLLLFVFIVAAIVLGLVQMRLRQVRSKAALELSLAHSQQRALAAQLKPHFIFNAINSIHNYIRKNDKKQSSEYLLLFSKLMRQILMNSSQPMVSVARELELVRDYLDLEQMRFKDKMSYSLSVDPAIDQSVQQIPAQLLQPFLENAIWHGLMHKPDFGHLSLTLSLNGNHLVCVIEDDGVGREASRAHGHPDKNHTSAGMALSVERLRIMETILKQPMSIEVVDLKDDAGKALGTKVVVTVPFLNS